MQYTENALKVVFIIAIVALVLALINSIVLLYGLYKKKLLLIEALIIVFLALIVPFGLGGLAKSLSRRGGLDNALVTLAISGFILMVATSFFLNRKINKKD